MSNSDWRTWFKNAKEHLAIAKSAMNAGMEEVAYEKAIYSGECALKSVLVKNGSFTRGDWTHNQEDILATIKSRGLLNPTTLSQVEDLITDKDGTDGLSWVNLSLGMSHQDCPHVQQTRYPTDDHTSYEMLRTGNAKEKILLADRLIKILEFNF